MGIPGTYRVVSVTIGILSISIKIPLFKKDSIITVPRLKCNFIFYTFIISPFRHENLLFSTEIFVPKLIMVITKLI